MLKVFKILLGVFFSAGLAVICYGFMGYLDAVADAPSLIARAQDLIEKNRGGADLGATNLHLLLAVEDPNFYSHPGVDFSTPGAGATTITQSASKRLAFKEFRPGIRKIRQTGYALGLETKLSKDQILALWLDTLEMGDGPSGWMTGFFVASSTIYSRSPSALTESEFARLVAVLIAPKTLRLMSDDPNLAERTRRIENLSKGLCSPSDHGDVWLSGCKEISAQ